jgi:dihydroxyacetone kinase-like protein
MDKANATALKTAMIAAADAIVAAEPELTRVDMVIGDGDHGIGMKTGFTALRRELLANDYESPYALFHACGLCLVKSMGGSSGVLFGTLLIGGLEAIRGLDCLDGAAMCAYLCGGIDAVIRRGRAKAGDKTMVDALLPAKARMEGALAETNGVADILKAAEAGALEGVEASKAMLPRLGRSKNFRESAIGWPDPGAISVSVLFGGMARALAK